MGATAWVWPLGFEQAAWLWALPWCLLPWWLRSGGAMAHSWLGLLPADRASELIHRVLRAALVAALLALVLSLAGPYRSEYPVQRSGTGAEIVLVLDRSRSMDQGFAGSSASKAPKGTGPDALSYYVQQQQRRGQESKGKVARQLLSEFAARRPDDRFGMVAFSTLPMRVLDFTQKAEVIQAAITAGNIGRGLSETNIGLALQSALDFFEDRPYTGSRIIMLVSDGGDHLDADARERIATLAKRYRVSLYWIYIRSSASPGLVQAAEVAAQASGGEATLAPINQATDTVPEYFLHRFFASLGTPYRAYEAENTEALQAAIDDVNRLENLPITYTDTVPRRDLSPFTEGLALGCVLLLLAARLWELQR